MSWKQKLLRWLIRDMVRSYRWTEVLEIYWQEHRHWYNEENLPTALGSISEEFEELSQTERRQGLIAHKAV